MTVDEKIQSWIREATEQLESKGVYPAQWLSGPGLAVVYHLVFETHEEEICRDRELGRAAFLVFFRPFPAKRIRVMAKLARTKGDLESAAGLEALADAREEEEAWAWKT